MSESQPAAWAFGFGLRITPIAGRAFRFRRFDNALVVEVQRSAGWCSATITRASDEGLGDLESELADAATIALGPSSSSWWIETSAYRLPLPDTWTLHSSGDRNASPLFELLGPTDASIGVRTSRRMPALESFQGPGHTFRDIGQLERAGWIEFEHTDAARTWLHRHEQLHRGTTPFVVTLKAPLDQASAHMSTLATIVAQLELSEGGP